ALVETLPTTELKSGQPKEVAPETTRSFQREGEIDTDSNEAKEVVPETPPLPTLNDPVLVPAPSEFRRYGLAWLALLSFSLTLLALGITELAGLTSLFGGPRASQPTSVAGSDDKLPSKFTNALGTELVRIPAGRAWLGDNEVTMPHDIYLGKYEVTQ